MYLLDDPMSAVDSHVGAQVGYGLLLSQFFHLMHTFQLFCAVIGPEGMLRNKTRVLVTNEMTFLKHSDLILIMKGELNFIFLSFLYSNAFSLMTTSSKNSFQDGMVEHQGTYQELMHSGALEPLLEECEKEEERRRKQDEEESDVEGCY